MSSKLSLAFRKAASRDVDALVKVYADSFADKNEATDLDGYIRWSVADRDYRVIIAETADSKIAGFVMTEFNSSTMRNAVNVAQLAVSPEFQGQGVGRALLEQVEETALKNEFDTVTLQVRKGNTRARGLYDSMGFREMGEEKKYYRDGESAIEMKKYLNPAVVPKAFSIPRYFRRMIGIYA
ncbi:MAG: GNAT family N-acetyltransferase [Alphaproteobacteria bacterium]|nr:GNAT family N-acetyltransferase [Alphaproteobacteria bacterium]